MAKKPAAKKTTKKSKPVVSGPADIAPHPNAATGGAPEYKETYRAHNSDSECACKDCKAYRKN